MVIQDGKLLNEIYGGEPNTTNNRMELIAVIKGLQNVTGISDVRVNTDSMYVKNGITLWIKKWEENGWKTSAKKDVANRDLWVKLQYLVKNRKVIWNWVKGHSGDEGNERADFLANKGVADFC